MPARVTGPVGGWPATRTTGAVTNPLPARGRLDTCACSAPRTWSVLRQGRLRRDIPLGVTGRCDRDRPGSPADAGGAGCGRPRLPPGDRGRSPPGPVHRAAPAGDSPTAARSGHAGPGAATRQRSPGHGSTRSGRQPSPALAAAGLDDRPPGAVGHPVTKSVPLGTLPDVGLVGALHGGLLGGGGTEPPRTPPQRGVVHRIGSVGFGRVVGWQRPPGAHRPARTTAP